MSLVLTLTNLSTHRTHVYMCKQTRGLHGYTFGIHRRETFVSIPHRRAVRIDDVKLDTVKLRDSI